MTSPAPLPGASNNSPTIVLTSAGSTNPYRQLAAVKQTTSNAWQGVNSAGITAQLLAEAVTATDATPTMGQIQIWPQKFAAWVFGSFESIQQDTNFAEQLPGLLADAKDIIEETQFAVGTGGTGNSTAPSGVLHALGAGQKVAAALGTGGALSGTGANAGADVYNLQAALGPRFRKSRSVGWVANITSINKLRGLDQYGGSSFWANFGDDTPEQLLGKPIHESPSLTTATATGTGTATAVMVYGDWTKFYVVDRIGTSMIYEPMITGTGNAANLPNRPGRMVLLLAGRLGCGHGERVPVAGERQLGRDVRAAARGRPAARTLTWGRGT